MTAQSVTGTGPGASDLFTTKELAKLANGPSIIFSGLVNTELVATSPPITSDEVVFPYALPGGADDYVVILTTVNAGYAYVSDRDEDDDGNFTGFTFISESDGIIMYIVAKVGAKPNL